MRLVCRGIQQFAHALCGFDFDEPAFAVGILIHFFRGIHQRFVDGLDGARDGHEQRAHGLGGFERAELLTLLKGVAHGRQFHIGEGAEGFFKETTPYAPNSPYSASKAGSDFLVRAYHHTFGLNVTTSNCSNNYGPKQHSEKLIPTIIRNCLNLSPIPIYGNGQNIRDWLYVTDHAKAIDLIFHHGKSGETYNVGGHNELTNMEITHAICAILDDLHPRRDGKKYAELITFVKDRAGHDLRYAIDPEKITRELGYRPDETFKTGIVKTVKWYLDRA